MTKEMSQKLSKQKRELLLKTGIHFGHKKSRRHPSMIPYLYGQYNHTYIIDIEKTEQELKKALEFLQSIVKEGKKIIFVASKPNICNFFKKLAQENKLFYLTERWIGGTLTNFSTIKKRLKYFKELEEKKKSDEFKQLSKKEKKDILDEIEKLQKTWGGIKELTEIPAALFLLDVPNNYLAIKEAKKTGVKVIAVCDSDADITNIDYPIPANDDSLPAIKYLLERVLKSIKKASESQSSRK